MNRRSTPLWSQTYYYNTMEIIIVKANADCFKKYLQGLTAEAEERLRSSLRVLRDPSGCGFTDIQTGSQLKAQAAKLSADAELQSCNALKAVWQYINALDDADEVVILDARRYSNYDILCWNNALWAKTTNHNPVEVYHNMRYDLPQSLFPRYEVLFFADLGFEQYFGEPDKNKRICRFCNEQGAGIFGDKKNSHAISWFLGNDALFCLEECKTCNNTFGRTIENALSSNLSTTVPRSIARVATASHSRQRASTMNNWPMAVCAISPLSQLTMHPR